MRGLARHLARLTAANHEMFGVAPDPDRAHPARAGRSHRASVRTIVVLEPRSSNPLGLSGKHNATSPPNVRRTRAHPRVHPSRSWEGRAAAFIGPVDNFTGRHIFAAQGAGIPPVSIVVDLGRGCDSVRVGLWTTGASVEFALT
jgi:hypothetical protein